jgi:hypothetical protein
MSILHTTLVSVLLFSYSRVINCSLVLLAQSILLSACPFPFLNIGIRNTSPEQLFEMRKRPTPLASDQPIISLSLSLLPYRVSDVADRFVCPTNRATCMVRIWFADCLSFTFSSPLLCRSPFCTRAATLPPVIGLQHAASFCRAVDDAHMPATKLSGKKREEAISRTSFAGLLIVCNIKL